MSRVPVSRTRTTSKPTQPVPGVKPRTSTTSLRSTSRTLSPSSPSFPRTKSPAKSPTRSSAKKTFSEDEEASSKPALSLREQIALKRKEAKELQEQQARIGYAEDFGAPEDAIPTVTRRQNEETGINDLGRWSIRETIERAQSSGIVNFSSRELRCIPSALFEIHLGVKPEPLRSVSDEPPLPPSSESGVGRRKGGSTRAWYEQRDLHILEAWNNEIQEIQPEISLFGSLQTIDLHQNKISSLPDSFCDLTALAYLDLSCNSLTTLPTNLFALPNLIELNIAHNEITSLPFSSPFSGSSSTGPARRPDPIGFFAPEIVRAEVPLPKLQVLDASSNKLKASGIDCADRALPSNLARVDFSGNPLGSDDAARELICAFGRLSQLKELKLVKADIGDDVFSADVWPSEEPSRPYPNLRIFDCSETRLTKGPIEEALAPLGKDLNFDFTTEDPPEGVLRVLVGKPVKKEAWEIEAERKAAAKGQKKNHSLEEEFETGFVGLGQRNERNEVVKESWELEAEQELMTEGAKRRARAQAAAAAAANTSSSHAAPPSLATISKRAEIVKEAWEIEAEQGLLSEGAKRRARAAAAAARAEDPLGASGHEGPSVATSSPTSPPGASLTNPRLYDSRNQKLILPPSKRAVRGQATSSDKVEVDGLLVPVPTLPLTEILSQPFSSSLRALNLANRRMDSSFVIPTLFELETKSNLLPNLEELTLEGCGLGDSVPVGRSPIGESSTSSPRTNEPLLPLLAQLFPSLRMLDLSENELTSASLTKEALSTLMLASEDSERPRKGLKHLRLRGNRLTDLAAFKEIAHAFKENREVAGWELEELDLRGNDINRLPPEMGLLPLDVFLVEGNIFRAPQRRVWEREGTKGLLNWLRGRIE